MVDRNIEYYNQNAKAFYDGTVNADMSYWRDKFEKYLPEGASVLDAGCGSGRDSLAFKNHGYKVTAFDASTEMCKLASELIGDEVRQLRFEELDYENQFDGIWACASLLHVPEDKLDDAIQKLCKALKKNGVLYASFKYGEGSKARGDRSFTDMNEKRVEELFNNNGCKLLESEISVDVRQNRNDEKWINIVMVN